MNIVRVKSGNVEIEVPFERITEMFANVGPIQEVFALTKECGACGSTNTRLNHKSHGDYDFFEGVCMDCTAALGFGQRKDGTGIFPKMKDKDGNTLPDKGWAVYQKSGSWTKTTQKLVGREDDVDEASIPF